MWRITLTKRNYEHLCNNKHEHRLYHAIGQVCTCPEPCSCGSDDLDILVYGPNPLEVSRNDDYTPVWMCAHCRTWLQSVAEAPSARETWDEDY